MRRVAFVVLFVVCSLGAASALAPARAGAAVSTGGGGWFWALPQPQGNGLNAIDFVSATRGWAVGAFGTIMRTTDGGATWRGQTVPTESDVRAVDFVDSQNGWALAIDYFVYNAEVLRTTDGGAHWRRVWRTTEWLEHLEAISARSALLVGGDGFVARTSDGGATWKKSVATAFRGGYLYAVDMADRSTGWACGVDTDPEGYMDLPVLLRTTDGGDTWQRQTHGFADGALYSVDAVNGSTAVVCGDRRDPYQRPVALLTTDGGATWQDIAPLRGEVLTQDTGGALEAAFADASSGVLVWTRDSVIRVSRTADGGLTWVDETMAPGFPTYDGALSRTDATHVWRVSDSDSGTPGVWRSTDAGATWSGPPPTTRVSPAAISFVSSQRGWALDNQWNELGSATSASVLGTSNGGATWTRLSADVPFRGADLDFADALNGLMVGYDSEYHGAIARTTNGGASWVLQSLPSPAPALWTVDCLSATSAWAGGEGGTVLRTVDGGASWQPASSGLPSTLGGVSDIHFMSSTLGILCLGDTSLYRTTDGGTTWSRVGANWNGNWRPVAMAWPDKTYGWAAGGDATVIATSDGGKSWVNRSPALLWPVVYEAVSFSDRLNGWVGGYLTGNEWGRAVLLRTTDGGRSWRMQRLGRPYNSVTDLWARSATDVVLAHVDGLFTTSTGGVSPSDKTPPTAAVRKPAGTWHNHPVKFSFSASDSGSGVLATYWRLDRGWTARDPSVTVRPTEDGSMDGMHRIRVAPIDAAGNGALPKTVSFGLDTSMPTTYAAPRSAVRPGGTVDIYYKVEDWKPGCGKARVTLKIATLQNKVKASVAFGTKATNRVHHSSYRCGLPVGKYICYVYARDIAGNPPYEMYYSYLTVKAGAASSRATGAPTALRQWAPGGAPMTAAAQGVLGTEDEPGRAPFVPLGSSAGQLRYIGLD